MIKEQISKYYELIIGVLGVTIALVPLFASSEFRKSKWKWLSIIVAIIIILCLMLKWNNDRGLIVENETNFLKKDSLRIYQHTSDSVLLYKKFDEILNSQGLKRDSISNRITYIKKYIQENTNSKVNNGTLGKNVNTGINNNGINIIGDNNNTNVKVEDHQRHLIEDWKRKLITMLNEQISLYKKSKKDLVYVKSVQDREAMQFEHEIITYLTNEGYNISNAGILTRYPTPYGVQFSVGDFDNGNKGINIIVGFNADK